MLLPLFPVLHDLIADHQSHPGESAVTPGKQDVASAEVCAAREASPAGRA